MRSMAIKHVDAFTTKPFSGNPAAVVLAAEGLSEEQMTTIHDPQGWAAKDHLVHIAAWERSVAVFLQGRPRHEGR